ncbi:hypothetical protein VP01_13432g1, partial [Puccinia sorghi]
SGFCFCNKIVASTQTPPATTPLPSDQQKPPPPLQHPAQMPNSLHQAPLAEEFNHLSCIEPMKIKELWFSGDSAQLLSFLCH